MLIEIGKNHRITSNDRQFILEERANKRKKDPDAEAGEVNDGWKTIGYYAQFIDAVNALHRRNILTSDAVGVKAVLEVIELSKQEITAALLKRQEIRREQLSLFG